MLSSLAMTATWRVLERDALLQRLLAVRARTERLVASLSPDEQLAQPFADASPTKWHLGHTSWFFERFVLAAHAGADVDPHLEYVFNSYYEAVGTRQPRAERGSVVSPTVDEVRRYRARVDEGLASFARDASTERWSAAAAAIELGTHHEEQHQELILTDLLATRSAVRSPSRLRAALTRPSGEGESVSSSLLAWSAFEGGVAEIGWDPSRGFAFDNECPRHRVFLEPFELAQSLVTNQQVLEFIADGGYRTPSLWLSDGLARVRTEGWTAPMHFRELDGLWLEHGIDGLAPVQLHAPARHLSYFEADAIARWLGARLPTEAEWELAAVALGTGDDDAPRHAQASTSADRVGAAASLWGQAWQWTQSAYQAYPRFSPFGGSFAEYNGKFMCGQLVLRGGSDFTPQDHVRVTYRNFFPPEARWQRSGLRLARWR